MDAVVRAGLGCSQEPGMQSLFGVLISRKLQLGAEPGL